MARARRRPAVLPRVRHPGTGEELDIYTRGGTPGDPQTLGLPRTVRVLGQTYSVITHSKIFESKRGAGPLMGFVMYASRVIVIDAELARATALSVLRHEMGHVYIRARRAADPAVRALTPSQVEAICDLIADVLEDRT